MRGMANDDIRTELLDALRATVPGFDATGLDATLPLREQVELDSMDWVNVVSAVEERLGLQIPEADYARLATLDAAVAYVAARRAAA